MVCDLEANLPLNGDEAVDAVLEQFPAVGVWFAQQGLICTECGEVFWGSLRELAEYRGLSAFRFQKLLKDLNVFLAGSK